MLTLKTSLLLFLCLFTLLDSLPTANAWGKPLPQGRHLKSYYKRRHLLSPRQSGSVPVPIDCSAVCPDPDMKGNPFAGNICTTGQGGKVHQFECDYTQKSSGAALACTYDGNGVLTSTSTSALARCYATISG